MNRLDTRDRSAGKASRQAARQREREREAVRRWQRSQGTSSQKQTDSLDPRPHSFNDRRQP